MLYSRMPDVHVLGKRIMHVILVWLLPGGFLFQIVWCVCGVTHMVGMIGGGAWQVRNATDIVIFSGWLPSASAFDDLAFDIVAMVRTLLTAWQGPKLLIFPPGPSYRHTGLLGGT